jgi:hypothetical protein
MTDDQQLNFFNMVEPTQRRGEYELPVDARIDTCKSCGAQIVWTHRPHGRAMPLSLATIQSRGGKKYCLSHFADCPDSREWSRKR